LTGDKPAVAAPQPVAPAAAKPAAPAAAKPAPPPKPEAPKPLPWDSELVRGLKSQYGSGIREACTYVGQKYLVVDSTLIYEILLRMREEQLFDYCVDITAVTLSQARRAIRRDLHPVLVPQQRTRSRQNANQGRRSGALGLRHLADGQLAGA
jgi:hypothetical protein